MALLPTQKTKITQSINNQKILIYGPAKIGKTSFAAEMESPIFVATERGYNALEVYKADCDSWTKFKEICLELYTEITAGKSIFKTIVIDTIDNLYKQCEAETIEKYNEIHTKERILDPSDLAYGKGANIINTEFFRVLKKLSMLPVGLVMISHSKEREIDSRVGKFKKTSTALSGACASAILGFCDLNLFFDIEHVQVEGKSVERRVIRTVPSKFFDAGSRWNIPDTIDLSFSAFQEAYEKSTPKKAPEKQSVIAANTSTAGTVPNKSIKK